VKKTFQLRFGIIPERDASIVWFAKNWNFRNADCG
jgi:hypothetical protein